ncbi:diacylglycerol/lipid kinase family protein [Paracnuella aquatica]|uniref:diacylglycerol/lipid kinase family protein n=1 Tax=Paracnuella aquatica TaxID=2268757 RepID=UPI000DEF5094|nr:diacylglycerol kinase family protein [Paracnuella aquatica]RPD50829.1 diacylglycerol kinase [Paracnuella aquatica]
MPRHLLFLINPISGTASKAGLQELIRQKMEAAGLSYAIRPTVASGDYSYLDNEIGNYSEIIICGGDGTINSVVQGMRHHGLPFGLLPMGSGNGLALSAGISRNLPTALDVIVSGTPQLTDAFYIAGRFACMLSGLGFDAQVAHDFANAGKRGLTTYVQKIIAGFWSCGTYPFELEHGQSSLQFDAYFISIANSNQFGNQFTIAPRASLHDGLLDVVIMLRQSKWSVLLQTLLQISGRTQLQSVEQISADASVLYFQTDKLRIHNTGSAPLHIDGDPAETASVLDVEVIPGAFQLIYPAGM